MTIDIDEFMKSLSKNEIKFKEFPYKRSNDWLKDIQVCLESKNQLEVSTPLYIIDEFDICSNLVDSTVYAMNAKYYTRMKGENEQMKQYDIDFMTKKEEIEEIYRKKVAEAKEAKDRAILEAEHEHDMAKMKADKEEKAAELKAEYDAYIAKGFTAKQAETFLLKMMEK